MKVALERDGPPSAHSETKDEVNRESQQVRRALDGNHMIKSIKAKTRERHRVSKSKVSIV